MPQLQLPIFPGGMSLINANLGFVRDAQSLTYFYGNLPVFTHGVDDLRSFRMITSQFYINGSAKQAEICRAFGVSSISVKRYVKLYRQKGVAGFFEEPHRPEYNHGHNRFSQKHVLTLSSNTFQRLMLLAASVKAR